MADVLQASAVAATTQWQVRPFGNALGDVDIDPLSMPRPVAAAGVLAACLDASGSQPDRDALLAWPVSRRLQGLLAVTIATRGDHWVLTATCTGPDCGKPMDLPLSFDDFLRAPDPAQSTCTMPDGRSVDVTVPTGVDQLAWLADGGGEPAAIAGRLVSLPADVNTISPDWLETIEAALEEADPLTTLEIKTACPECGAAVSIPLDLEARCLALLAAERPRLIDEIHVLANTYHWSEAEILAIPAARRRQYLARIESMRS